MNFRTVCLLVKKEARESFNSPMPYIFMVVFFLLTGWLFISSLFLGGQSTLEEFFGPLPLLCLFFLPAFTMRLFSEEYKSGTIEVLATLPLRDTEIVLSKYLSALLVWALMLALSFFYVVLLLLLGKPDLGQIMAGFVGAFLLGGFFASIGLFASALSRSQVVGFLLGFLISFGFFLVGKTAAFAPAFLSPLLSYLGVDMHYTSFLLGVVDSRDLIYFISGQVLFFSATLAVFNSRRWR